MDVQGARQLLDIRSRSVSGTDDVDELCNGVRVVSPKRQAEAAEDLINSLVSVPELTIFVRKKLTWLRSRKHSEIKGPRTQQEEMKP